MTSPYLSILRLCLVVAIAISLLIGETATFLTPLIIFFVNPDHKEKRKYISPSLIRTVSKFCFSATLSVLNSKSADAVITFVPSSEMKAPTIGSDNIG